MVNGGGSRSATAVRPRSSDEPPASGLLPRRSSVRSDPVARLLDLLGLGRDAGDAATADFAIDFRSDGSELVFAEGSGPRLAVVLGGFVRYEKTFDGQVATLTTLCSEGDWYEITFGEGQYARTVAVVDSWVASIPTRAVGRLVRDNPPAAPAFYRGLVSALRASNDTAINLMFKDAIGKIATILLDLERRFARYDEGIVWIQHNLRQLDIGNAVGCSREVTNKTLASFARRGILTLDGMRFVIHDRDWLVARANSW